MWDNAAGIMSMGHRVCGILLCGALAACTPQAGVLMAVLPEGTVPTLLSHFERVDDSIRQRLVEFERRGDWKGLAAFAEENLAKDKANADWWMVTGYAYSRLEQYSRAIEYYAEAVRLAPDEATGWNLLAQAYRGAGQPERAIATLDNALRVRQDSPMTFYVLGESYSDVGRLEAAAGAYQQALKLNNEFAQAWFGMGRVDIRLGRDAEAREIVKLLERLDQGLASELANLLSQRK
jgi:tetratricopeptide (TPR) repeat protein